MSFTVLKFPPQVSTRAMRAPLRWMGLKETLSGAGHLSSCINDDDNDPGKPRRRINWGAVATFAVSLAISGGFWTGVGLIASRILR